MDYLTARAVRALEDDVTKALFGIGEARKLRKVKRAKETVKGIKARTSMDDVAVAERARRAQGAADSKRYHATVQRAISDPGLSGKLWAPYANPLRPRGPVKPLV